MNKKILLSLLNIGLVAVLVSIGVYALYTATVSSTGNTFSTSHLTLKADGSGTSMTPLNVSGIAPGDDGATYFSQTYALAKDGSVPAGNLSFAIDNVAETAGLDGNKDLGANLLVSLYYPDTNTLVGTYSIAQLQSGVVVTPNFDGTPDAGGNRSFEVAPNLPSTVGNSVQGDGLSFDGHLTLEQTVTAH